MRAGLETRTTADGTIPVRANPDFAGKEALGKIAFSGREHLLAIRAPADAKMPGMMAYTLRYAAELRNPADYFSDVKKPSIDDEQLSLAKGLVQRKAGKFDPKKFTDNYEAALRELVEAKLKHLPLPLEKKPPARQSDQPDGCFAAKRPRAGGEEAADARNGPEGRVAKAWAARCQTRRETAQIRLR